MRIGLVGNSADAAALAAIVAGEHVVIRLDPANVPAAVIYDDVMLLVIAPCAGVLPDISGLVALLPLHAVRPVAVLALVPRDAPEAMAAAFDGGVADCAGYPIERHEVSIRIRALIRRQQTADCLRAEAEEVRRLAHTDPVTGLANRHHFDAELRAAFALATAANRPLALVMIDVDGFKPINDVHGHVIGDRVLRAIGARLAANVRAIDTLARYGGDELAIIMPDIGCEAARRVAERLRAMIAETPIVASLAATVSIGIAGMSAGENPAGLLDRADAALYAAKIGGRNRVAEAA